MSMGRTVWGATTTGSTTDFTAVCFLAERPLSDSACRIVITDTAVVFILRQSYMSQMCAIVYWKCWMLIFFKMWYESTIPNVRRVHLLFREIYTQETPQCSEVISPDASPPWVQCLKPKTAGAWAKRSLAILSTCRPRVIQGIPRQTETLSEWANILHDAITGVVWYFAKIQGIFTIQMCLFTISMI